MHGLTGDFYEVDFSPIMDRTLQEAITKYKLKNERKNEGLTGTYTNDKCSVHFWVSDRRSFKWHFYNPIEDFKYDLTFYLAFVKNITKQNHVFSSKIKNIEELIEAHFINFNRELLTYLEAPMRGDFSWHTIYQKGLKKRMKHAEFAARTKYTDSNERVKLAEMFFSGIEGRDEAIENYLKKYYPDGGKEFEI